MGRAIRFLCAADLHLGRRPAGIPAALNEACSAEGLLKDIVETASAQRVDALLLSGDIIDRENGFYEAVGKLERAAANLGELGIAVFAVAGNHDFEALPRVARAAQSFRLLGAGGRWESVDFHPKGTFPARIHGWSFPAEHVRFSPLGDFAPASDRPSVTLLHCDLDVPGSRYAPVFARELRDLPAAFWALGHIHKCRIMQPIGSAPIIYPGSPQPLDISEPGSHGVVLAELSESGAVRFEEVPIARVRYDSVEIDLSRMKGDDDLAGFVIGALKDRIETLCSQTSTARHHISRVRLVGRSIHHAELRGLAVDIEQLDLSVGAMTASVDRLEIDTRPAVDVASLANRRDPVGELARLIGELESGTGPHPLLDAFARRDGSLRISTAYQRLGLPEMAEDETRQLLLRQSWRIMDELLAQKEEA